MIVAWALTAGVAAALFVVTVRLRPVSVAHTRSSAGTRGGAGGPFRS